MSSTTPLSNITNNSSNSLCAPRINTVDLPDVNDVATASLMPGSPSPHINHRDLHLWFEGIPETMWNPPPFQLTSNSLGLELLANATLVQDPVRERSTSPIITYQERCANLQNFGEPPLQWRPNPYQNWQDLFDTEWTMEDLTAWPTEAPAYQERPRTNE